MVSEVLARVLWKIGVLGECSRRCSGKPGCRPGNAPEGALFAAFLEEKFGNECLALAKLPTVPWTMGDPSVMEPASVVCADQCANVCTTGTNRPSLIYELYQKFATRVGGRASAPRLHQEWSVTHQRRGVELWLGSPV